MWLMSDETLLLVGRSDSGARTLLGRVIRPTRVAGSYIWESPDGSVGGVATTQLLAMRALERERGGAGDG